jgi:DNA invertase Pin-like site-specific DNA recombinase
LAFGVSGIRKICGAASAEIVETYEDYGKSGLTIRGRASLQRLIADVCTGAANFSVILV